MFNRELYKSVKELKELGLGLVARRELLENVDEPDLKFDTGYWRAIDAGAIDYVLEDELASDTSMLGCFNAWFIADITGLDTEVIEKAQEDGSFELLGELMLQHIDDVVTGMVNSDGYESHFARYDGVERYSDTLGKYIFRIR